MKYNESEKLKNIVAFCVLMENNEGILGKSPDYILEKFNRFCNEKTENGEWQWGLDISNRNKLTTWVEKWL